MFDTLSLLEDHGYANIIIYNDHPDQQTTGIRPEYSCLGLEYWVYTQPSTFYKFQSAKETIAEVIRRHHPDVCHIHNLQNYVITEYLVQQIPCARSVHDPRLYCFTHWRLLPNKSICPYPLGTRCIEQGCLSKGVIPRNIFDKNAKSVIRNLKVHKLMPVIIGESRAQIECMLENGFSPDQITWLPNFTPLRPRTEVEAFVEHHYQPDEKIVLFVGRASYEKGLYVLLEAAGRVTRDCRFVIITAGPLLEEIQSLASPFGEKITVIPGLSYEETRKYYARSLVVVVPSVWIESFCLVGLEAYANMKPVIGSRVGGIKDWLKENDTGWFFEPGDARDLAKKIDLALEYPERTQQMGRNAYDRACNYYCGQLYLSRLLGIYEKAIRVFHERHK